MSLLRKSALLFAGLCLSLALFFWGLFYGYDRGFSASEAIGESISRDELELWEICRRESPGSDSWEGAPCSIHDVHLYINGWWILAVLDGTGTDLMLLFLAVSGSSTPLPDSDALLEELAGLSCRFDQDGCGPDGESSPAGAGNGPETGQGGGKQ